MAMALGLVWEGLPGPVCVGRRLECGSIGLLTLIYLVPLVSYLADEVRLSEL